MDSKFTGVLLSAEGDDPRHSGGLLAEGRHESYPRSRPILSMSVIGDFRIPSEMFALDHALSTVPVMTIEADPMATHSPKEVFPFFWATGGDFETFKQALDDDPSVETASVAEEVEDEVLYRLVWGEDFRQLIHDMIDHHAAIMEATAQDSHWRLRLRFAEEDMVSSFQTHFREKGHDFEVISLRSPTGPRQRKYGLTSEQYHALVAAVREGYFSIPRTTSVDDLGATLDISPNAVSERIRRGCESLIRTSLIIDTDDTE